MKIKYILSVIAIVAFTKDSFAQYSQDAVRFSTFQTGSTSRVKAVGNAGTAIGGDLSNISGNPAGLGFFTHSEVSITPEYDNSKVSADFFGPAGNSNKNNVNLNNAAIVFYQRLNTPKGQDKSKGWLSVNYGAAYSRTNDFYENIAYGNKNPTNSISDYYANLANNEVAQYGSINPQGLDGWGYNQKLTDNYGTGAAPNYASNVVTGVNQASNIERRGGQSELNLSFGANYSNKLFIGLGIALTDIRYDSFSTFGESGNAIITSGGSPTAFNSAYTQDQSTRGSGFNAKMGVIYKPVQALRLGFVFTSPTFYNIDDSYSEALATKFAGGNTISNSLTDPYQLNYNMRTPLKLAGGASVFIGKYGFITGDAEYIDYSTTHLSSNDSYTADIDNGNIKAVYRSTVNLHAGAEINVNSIIYLRGGYSQQGSPFKDKSVSSDIKTVTGGIGLHFGPYFVDATYAHVSGKRTIFPYEIGANSPAAALDKTNNNAFLTLGYKF